MQYIYDTFVLRRFAEGRIFFVNSSMPFEYFMFCFQAEQPFFLISQLEDGRIAITPNAMFLPSAAFTKDYGPYDLLPTKWEYVWVKNGTYPVILSAHPVQNVEEWLKIFERNVKLFAKQSLWDFVSSSYQFEPLQIRSEITQREFPQREFTTPREPVHA